MPENTRSSELGKVCADFMIEWTGSEYGATALEALIASKVEEASIKLLDNVVTDFNNMVADFQNDNDIDNHHFVVGLLWGVIAKYRIPLSGALQSKEGDSNGI